MHKLKSLIANTKVLFAGFGAALANYYRKNSVQLGKFTNILTIAAMIIGIVALIALVYYQVRPMELVDIKVPVSTEKPTYRAGENVNGIFFGEVYYEGEVRISRDVFCAGYRAKILTDEGDEIFTGVSRPVVLKGDLRTIGKLPANVPEGKNCVIQFVNSYDINTPFGIRHEERTYYTQNFLIISDRADSDQTDLEDDEIQTPRLFPTPSEQEETDKKQAEQSQPTQQNQQPAPEPQPQPAEPIQPPQECAIELLGIKLFCS
jgi:hypothetical protein